MIQKVQNLMKSLVSKKTLMKIFSFLLVFICIFCFAGIQTCIVDCQAVAVADDIILVVIAFLMSCGLTFATSEIASSTAENFYLNCQSDTQSFLSNLPVVGDLVNTVGFITQFTSAQYSSMIEEFRSQFPQYSNLYLNSTSIVNNQIAEGSTFLDTLNSGGTISVSSPWVDDSNVFFQVADGITCNLLGEESLKTVIGTDLFKQLVSYNKSFDQINTQYALFSIPALNLKTVCVFGYNNVDTAINVMFEYSSWISRYQINSFPICNSNGWIYNGELCSLTYNSLLEAYNISSASFGNVINQWVCDGSISKDSPLIDCDNLTIKGDNALGQLLLGADVFNVGIDTQYLPGIDNFPSLSGDISDVNSYPDSISVGVPSNIDDLIDTPIDDIRNPTLTDTDTDTDIDTGTDTGSDVADEDKSNPKYPSVPQLSLPEILFKEKFPFCLPWDLYNVFANLVADPEPPCFNIPFKIERLNIDYEFTIDLSMFDDVARISRFFSSIAFIVFLILISRKIIGAQ